MMRPGVPGCTNCAQAELNLATAGEQAGFLTGRLLGQLPTVPYARAHV